MNLQVERMHRIAHLLREHADLKSRALSQFPNEVRDLHADAVAEFAELVAEHLAELER